MVVGVLFGAVIWILFELNKGLAKQDFQYNKFFKLNAVPLVTNILCSLAILWSQEDIKDLFVVTKFSSVMLGMAGQGLFKKIYGIFEKNIETKIGINR